MLESDSKSATSSCPRLVGHPRLLRSKQPRLDGRDQPGHDVDGAERMPGMTASPSLLRLAGILHRLEGREFDVVEFAVDLLDLADVDVLHDVTGFRIDRDRAARAFPLHALHRSYQCIAVGLAAGLLQGLVDQADAVIAADRHEARAL